MAAIFPSIEGSADFDDLLESYPDVLRGLFDLEGTDLSTRRMRAASSCCWPPRCGGRHAVLWKGAAVAAEALVACAAGFGRADGARPLIGLDLSLGRIAFAFAGVAALGLLSGWLALGLGAAIASRLLAIGLPAGLAAVGYLVNGVHDLAGWLDPLRFASAFWWVGSSPLQGGTRWTGVAVVLAAAAVVLVAGALLIERRDLETP